jgi:hypothetical protein
VALHVANIAVVVAVAAASIAAAVTVAAIAEAALREASVRVTKAGSPVILQAGV